MILTEPDIPAHSRQTLLILASASPRRRAMLALLIDDFEVMPADIDEEPLADEKPDALVHRLAQAKMRAVATKAPGRFVLGSDTEVVLDGRCLGKPRDAGHARAMLRALSGREHEVLSGVALGLPDGQVLHDLARSQVRFDALSDEWIEAYVASGEPMDKAGAYALQGGAAACISQLEGSDSAVIGLPLQRTARLLAQAGLLIRTVPSAPTPVASGGSSV